MSERYRKSHLQQKRFFILDNKNKFVAEYTTNEFGRNFVFASLSKDVSGSIQFHSALEIKDAMILLGKILKETRGKWVKKKKQSLEEGGLTTPL